MMARRNLFIVLGVAAVAALLGGSFLIGQSSEADNPFVRPAPVSQKVASATTENDIGLPVPRPAPTGYTEYQSATYHFSLFYPQSMTVRTYKEKGTATTVLFEEPFSEQAFQVFVVPYGEKKITPERFKADIPSGIIASSTSIVLDGVPAEAFYSSNHALGDTYEVWFISNGFLYEVTTYAAYDEWLRRIMSSWKFL